MHMSILYLYIYLHIYYPLFLLAQILLIIHSYISGYLNLCLYLSGAAGPRGPQGPPGIGRVGPTGIFFKIGLVGAMGHTEFRQREREHESSQVHVR